MINFLIVSFIWWQFLSAMAEVTLTDAANISLDLDSGIDFTVTLGGNRTLDDPTNVQVGQKGRIRIKQDATGGRTLSYGSQYKFTDNGTAPTIDDGASNISVLYYDCRSSSQLYCSVMLDVN